MFRNRHDGPLATDKRGNPVRAQQDHNKSLPHGVVRGGGWVRAGLLCARPLAIMLGPKHLICREGLISKQLE